MRIYDIIVILNYRDSCNIKNFILSFKNAIIYNNFLIINIENWKILKFKYKIGGERGGVFLLFRFLGKHENLKNILEYLKLDVSVIRFLLTHLKKNNYFLNIFSLKKRKKKNVTKKKIKRKT